MKKRKKSLVGYVGKGWFFRYSQAPYGAMTAHAPTLFKLRDYALDRGIKVRITLEEL